MRREHRVQHHLTKDDVAAMQRHAKRLSSVETVLKIMQDCPWITVAVADSFIHLLRYFLPFKDAVKYLMLSPSERFVSFNSRSHLETFIFLGC